MGEQADIDEAAMHLNETATAEKSTVYEIKTIDDFLHLPDHAIEKALAEFVPTIKAARAMYRMAVTLAEAAGAPPDSVPMTIPTMRFVDDNRKTVTFNLSVCERRRYEQEKAHGEQYAPKGCWKFRVRFEI